MIPSEPVLGCIADDFTGAVDVAAGMFDADLRTVIVTGNVGELVRDADVIVIALKTRTIAPDDAIATSLRAAETLRALGVQRFFFKYCSTFDSTSQGNIGPVADALLNLVDQQIAVVVPGYPRNGRTVRGGLLYVNGTPLADSPMRHHPLTPMTCSNLVELLGVQSRHKVGLVPAEVVGAGSAAIRHMLDRLAATGARYAIIDTETDGDLDAIAVAVNPHTLLTGGAGLTQAVARLIPGRTRTPPVLSPQHAALAGRPIVLSGSCSAATLHQVEHFARTGPVLHIDPRELSDPGGRAAEAVAWAKACNPQQPALISTTVNPVRLRNIQRQVGNQNAATRVETFFLRIAQLLPNAGFTRILVAGGETSGAVVAGLGIQEMVVATPIGSGLAWCVSELPAVAVALKSGNFGAVDVFTRAHQLLESASSPEQEREA